MAIDYLMISDTTPITCRDLPGNPNECTPGALYIDTPNCGTIYEASLSKVSYKKNDDDGSVEITDLETFAVIRISPIEYNPLLRVFFCPRYEEMKNKPIILP